MGLRATGIHNPAVSGTGRSPASALLGRESRGAPLLQLPKGIPGARGSTHSTRGPSHTYVVNVLRVEQRSHRCRGCALPWLWVLQPVSSRQACRQGSSPGRRFVTSAQASQ